MNVWQVLSGAGPVDAVSRQAVAFRALFRSWGWGGRDVAASIDPRANGFEPLRALHPAPGDTLLIHYSAYAPRLRGVLDLPGRKLLLSHNVTPARWLWDHDPPIALQCELGRRQLPEYAARCDLAAGVSAFNAAELGSEVVIPPLLDLSWLTPAAPGGDPVILFVGRLAPHKRQDEAIRAFALYRDRHAPGARLVLVGEPLNAKYLRALQDLAEAAGGGVTFEHTLSQAELAARYARAHAFLCLSEHEGFCVPLLEAFAAGVPVVARPAGAVPETAAGAALLVEDRDPAVVAELLHLAVTDAELRAELQSRGRERVAHYAPERTAQALRAYVGSESPSATEANTGSSSA